MPSYLFSIIKKQSRLLSDVLRPSSASNSFKINKLFKRSLRSLSVFYSSGKQQSYKWSVLRNWCDSSMNIEVLQTFHQGCRVCRLYRQWCGIVHFGSRSLRISGPVLDLWRDSCLIGTWSRYWISFGQLCVWSLRPCYYLRLSIFFCAFVWMQVFRTYNRGRDLGSSLRRCRLWPVSCAFYGSEHQHSLSPISARTDGL